MNEQQEQQRERMPLSFYAAYVGKVARRNGVFDARLVERIAREAERIGEDEDGLPRVVISEIGDYFIYDVLADETPLEALLVAARRRIDGGGGLPAWLREALLEEAEFIRRLGEDPSLLEEESFLDWIDEEEVTPMRE